LSIQRPFNERGKHIDATEIKVGKESIKRGKATLQSLLINLISEAESTFALKNFLLMDCKTGI